VRVQSLNRLLLAMLAALLVAGCASNAAVEPFKAKLALPAPPAIQLNISDIQPRSVAQAHIAAGLGELASGRWYSAQHNFERALAIAPRDVSANFLNAYTLHQLGRSVDPQHYETAAVGYRLAHKFDPQAWWITYHYGQLELERENYERALALFEESSRSRPNAPQPLLGLAICAYYLGDIETADSALQRAKTLLPHDNRLLRLEILISAASGDHARALRNLEQIRQQAGNPLLVRRLHQRIDDWRRMGAKDNPVSSEERSIPNSRSEAEPGQDTESTPRNRQIVLEATILRSTSSLVRSNGLNLLDGLSVLFSYDDERSLSQLTGDDDSVTRTITRSISSSELEYSLNIFNSIDDRSEIVARPSLVAMEDQTSTFFSGDLFLASISGQFDGETLTERVGVTVEVTPTFLSDEEFVLNINIGNSDFSTEAIAGTFQEALSISSSETNVSVRIKLGQTLLLAGLSERSDRNKESKVPIIGDIPILQNLFRTQEVQEVAAETIILLTPRRVIEYDRSALPLSQLVAGRPSTERDDVRNRISLLRQSPGQRPPHATGAQRGDLRMPDWNGSPYGRALWDEVVSYTFL